ncbi:MAG TPA: (2Fe-2S)-binding protein, partial [Thermoplasmata archaeon]|nr:(2Fe-2S)-binding protein [Thermoplasmata archaeon]
GVPVYTSHTVLRAEGKDRVERIIIARADEKFRPVPGTELSYEVDTVLVAVGLSSVNELYEEGRRLGVKVYSAGDAHEIAEASAAMFSGKIVAREILKDLGIPVEIPPDWLTIQAMLRSHPGPVLGYYPPPPDMTVYPIIRCAQEIPCNPCTDVCITDGIVIPEGNLLGRPKLVGDCVGCLKCVAICPGLAISLVDKRHDPTRTVARVTVPWEMPEELVHVGDTVPTTGFEGESVGTGKVLRILSGKSLNRRRLMVLEVPFADAEKVAGVRVRAPETPSTPEAVEPVTDDEVVICRCERVTKEMIAEYLRDSGSRDFNAIKAALRTGMGPCGGKTCAELTFRLFRELGVDPKSVTPPVHRPFTHEVPMKAFLVEGDGNSSV